jgi:hypothetical protein
MAYADPGRFWNHGSTSTVRTTQRSWFGDVVLIAFLLAQALDGAFTYVGVTSVRDVRRSKSADSILMTHLGHGPR